ncbi:MAG TPA: ComF family protein [Ktedonobacteraceae bacterium]|jgi:ComF family protein|nr:ComF family protein [Ktedonobacteraceae bacterium]
MNSKALQQQAQALTQRFLDVVFPPQCAGCKRNGYILCSSCIARIQPLPLPTCQHCCAPLPPDGICKACYYHRLALSGLRAIGLFQEPLRGYIHALKYKGNTRLAQPLGELLAQAYVRYAIQADMIVPVPLHSERERQRGYNHACLLARACSTKLGIPLHTGLLVRARATLAQVGLNLKDRRQNVAGAFVCSPPFTTGSLLNRRIIIVDDVSTTGSTLEACAAPLFSAGALAVWGLVLARSAF